MNGLLGDTAPASLLSMLSQDLEPQGWHFNINTKDEQSQKEQNGTTKDSRIQHTLSCLKNAILNKTDSLVLLGMGLHALQDIFAHTSEFVSPPGTWGIPPANFLYSHFLTGKNGAADADNPCYIDKDKSPRSIIPEEQNFSQRYSDTKTITMMYFILYLFNINNFVDYELLKVVKKRISYKSPCIDGFSLVNFMSAIISEEIKVPHNLKVLLQFTINHYETLGVEPDATDIEIRKAYLNAALKAHPDKNPGNKEEAEEEFKKIATAYEVLKDPGKRTAYDRNLDSSAQAQGTPDEPSTSSSHKSRRYRSEWSDPEVNMQQAEQLFKMVNELMQQYIEEQNRRTALGKGLANKAKERKWDEVAILKEQGAFLDELSDKGFGALHYAVCDEDYRRAHALLTMGANVNLQATNGKTSLHFAVEKNNYELCELLINKGAQQQYQDVRNKDTPLHFAIENKKDQRIQHLLIGRANEYGFLWWKDKSYNVTDLLGDTPLHLSIKQKQFCTTEMLVAYRAKTTVMNKQGETPVDLVKKFSKIPRKIASKLEDLSKQELANKSSCLVM